MPQMNDGRKHHPRPDVIESGIESRSQKEGL